MSKPDTSKYRGHPIELINTDWVYSNNGCPVRLDPHRTCGNCGKDQTPEGHDGCIGTLKGVMNACCGHGNTDQAYIQYETGKCVYGERALSIMRGLSGIVKNKYGCCYYAFKQDYVHIYDLYVLPGYRRQGHAKAILKEVIAIIREIGYIGSIQIVAIPTEDSIDKEALKSFYESLGLDVFEYYGGEG